MNICEFKKDLTINLKNLTFIGIYGFKRRRFMDFIKYLIKVVKLCSINYYLRFNAFFSFFLLYLYIV